MAQWMRVLWCEDWQMGNALQTADTLSESNITKASEKTVV
jgi:hypothetical protein